MLLKSKSDYFFYTRLILDDQALLVEKVTEEFTLTLGSLISFIGGTIGIFMGYSTLSLLQLLKRIYNKLN